jgi:hypothetical protein
VKRTTFLTKCLPRIPPAANPAAHPTSHPDIPAVTLRDQGGPGPGPGSGPGRCSGMCYFPTNSLPAPVFYVYSSASMGWMPKQDAALGRELPAESLPPVHDDIVMSLLRQEVDPRILFKCAYSQTKRGSSRSCTTCKDASTPARFARLFSIPRLCAQDPAVGCDGDARQGEGGKSACKRAARRQPAGMPAT